MYKVVPSEGKPEQEITDTLDAIVRRGAQQMLAQALQIEVAEYLARFAAEVDANGHRLVVGHGKAKSRKVTTSAGTVAVQAPRVKDRREGQKFTSQILPPYLRKSPQVESLLPTLYLKGLSTNNFKEALDEFFGEGTLGLSPASIAQLKTSWSDDLNEWKARPLTKRYAYLWADGVNVEVRLGEDKRLCLLVIIGVSETGDKELLAVQAGYRESKDSWLRVLEGLKARGLQDGWLAIADGGLGFWAALRGCEGFANVREQRCWVHKIANVLDHFPKRLQAEAKSLLHDMMRAESQDMAAKTRDAFKKRFQAKFPKAVECLEKDWSVLTTYFDYPAEHWIHLRSTNPIESSFATVKLRTRVTKGAGSATMAETMAFKLLRECEKRWRRVNAPHLVEKVLEGVEFKDGVMIPEASDSEVAAS